MYHYVFALLVLLALGGGFAIWQFSRGFKEAVRNGEIQG